MGGLCDQFARIVGDGVRAERGGRGALLRSASEVAEHDHRGIGEPAQRRAHRRQPERVLRAGGDSDGQLNRTVLRERVCRGRARRVADQALDAPAVGLQEVNRDGPVDALDAVLARGEQRGAAAPVGGRQGHVRREVGDDRVADPGRQPASERVVELLQLGERRTDNVDIETPRQRTGVCRLGDHPPRAADIRGGEGAAERAA